MKNIGLHASYPFPKGNQIRTLHSARTKRKLKLPNLNCITDDSLTDMMLSNANQHEKQQYNKK